MSEEKVISGPRPYISPATFISGYNPMLGLNAIDNLLLGLFVDNIIPKVATLNVEAIALPQ